MKKQPWRPADATKSINTLAKDDACDVHWTKHARDRLNERGLIIGDALQVLRRGFVYDDAEKATRSGLYKYRITGKTPNSQNREVTVIAIPDPHGCQIKIVTVMWKDEC